MASLEERIQQEQEKLKSLKAQLSKQQRRDDTRRKIIFGAAVVKLLDDLADEKTAKLRALLDARITRPIDRAFLCLAPLQSPKEVGTDAEGDQPR